LLSGCTDPDATFDFHSGFWVNLHHFLLQQASAETRTEGSAGWIAAVDYYRRVSKNLLAPEMADINNRLSALAPAAMVSGSGVPAPLAAVLNSVAAEYRQRWWPEHDRANRAWIAAVIPLLAKHAAGMKKD